MRRDSSRVSKVQGVVLKRVNFGESDRVVTVFTKERGKISVVAKGVRRIRSRRAPYLEPLNEVILILHKGKNFEIVSEAKGKQQPKLREDLKSLSFGFYAAELIDKLLPEQEPHEDVYILLQELLDNPELNENQVKQFTLQLLWQLGFLPSGHAPKGGLTVFVESVAERRIRSKNLVEAT